MRKGCLWNAGNLVDSGSLFKNFKFKMMNQDFDKKMSQKKSQEGNGLFSFEAINKYADN